MFWKNSSRRKCGQRWLKFSLVIKYYLQQGIALILSRIFASKPIRREHTALI